MTEHNNPIDADELITLTKEEEEFLHKYRKLTDDDKGEIKNYIFSFDTHRIETEE